MNSWLNESNAYPALQQLPDVEAQAYRPLDRSHRRWAARFDRFLAPREDQQNWFTRALAVFLVVPFAPLTAMDIDYQTYLYEVFHRGWVSRTVHFLVFPLVNIAVMVGLAQMTMQSASPETLTINPFAWNFAAVFALALWGWWMRMARRARSVSWAIVLTGAALGLWASANTIAAWTLLGTSTEGGLGGLPLWANPWLWVMGLSFVIACSHIREPDVPPRVSGSERWVPLRDYLLGTEAANGAPRTLPGRLMRLFFQLVWGAMAEFLAAQRLMPIALLRLMWRFGLAKNFKPGVEHAKRALENGQPALDFIGHGGGTRLHVPEATTSRAADT